MGGTCRGGRLLEAWVHPGPHLCLLRRAAAPWCSTSPFKLRTSWEVGSHLPESGGPAHRGAGREVLMAVKASEETRQRRA